MYGVVSILFKCDLLCVTSVAACSPLMAEVFSSFRWINADFYCISIFVKDCNVGPFSRQSMTAVKYPPDALYKLSI